jgi:transposase
MPVTSCAIRAISPTWEEIPPAKHGGGKRTVDMREVVNGVMYVLSTGCQWRYIPKDLPPRSTVNGYFCQWGWDGTLEKIHHALYVKCREQAEREVSPTACIVDSQSVKSAEKGGRIHTALMPASSSRARSATSWLIRSAWCCTCW